MRYPRYKQAQDLLNDLKSALSALAIARIIKLSHGETDFVDSWMEFKNIESIHYKLVKIGALGCNYFKETRNIRIEIDLCNKSYSQDLIDIKLSLIAYAIRHTEHFIKIGLKRAERTYDNFHLNKTVMLKPAREPKSSTSDLAVELVIGCMNSMHAAKSHGISRQAVSAALRVRGLSVKKIKEDLKHDG